MGPSAKVHSIDALEAYRAALAEFGVKAGDTLAGADVTIRRTFEELKERQRYWTRVLRERTEEVARVRSALSLAKVMKETGKSRAGELEIELRKAIRRQREAEEKLATVGRWLRTLPDARRDYDGPAHKLRGFLDGELQQALGVLENKIRALQAYLATLAPSAGLPSGGATPSPANAAKSTTPDRPEGASS